MSARDVFPQHGGSYAAAMDEIDRLTAEVERLTTRWCNYQLSLMEHLCPFCAREMLS